MPVTIIAAKVAARIVRESRGWMAVIGSMVKDVDCVE
jgi:hypothetical protein